MAVERVAERRDRPDDARPGRLWAVSLLGAAVALGAIAAVLLGVGETSKEPPPGPEGTRTVTISSRDHVDERQEYELQPPAGGDHAPIWANCGVYDTPVPPELAIHAMEHGAVWVTYPEDTDADGVSALRELVVDHYVGTERYLVLSPHAPQDEPVVVTAWGRQLRLQTLDDPRIGEFIRTFAAGRQSPEPQFPCSDGLGEPLQ